jgi:glutathionylspermidine amidase/synthetase
MSFGTFLYRYNGIHVYSNDSDDLINSEDSDDLVDVYHHVDGIQTGIRWQCVELARRYLILEHGFTFQSVENAYDIFNLSHFSTIHTHQSIPIRAIPNGNRVKTNAPHIGSLLIWSKEYDKNGTGHVAVMTHLYPHSIQIMEQNNTQPIRTISLSKKDGYVLQDPHVLGWINYIFIK